MASVQEESEDLSTCCVCLEPFDKALRKPKFLPCAHTNCLQCIKDMAKAPAMQLTCPVCRKVSELPANVESLPTNLYVTHIVQLNKEKADENRQRFWCETCERVAKTVCQQGNHTITDLIVADSTKVKSQLTQGFNQLNEAIANREESQEHLTEDRDWLRSKLQVIESKMEENSDCLAAVEKTELTSPGYYVLRDGLNTCCFAGDEDELVVAPSAVDHSLHIWSVCDGPNGNRRIDQSLLSLIGHKHALNTVRFCKATSSLVSCGVENVIKLWTPIYNQLII